MSPVEEKQQEVEQQALAVAERAKTIVVITTQEEYLSACEFGRKVSAKIKDVTEWFEALRVPAKAAYDAVLNRKKSVIDPLETAKRHLSGIIGNFEAAQEKLRLAEQRRLEEEEKRKRDTEQLEYAALLEKQGRTEEAEQVLEMEAAPVAVVVPREIPKAQGVLGRVTYSAECFDIKALCKAVAEGKQPTCVVQFNQTYGDQMARAQKDLFALPGCKVNKKFGTTFRS